MKSKLFDAETGRLLPMEIEAPAPSNRDIILEQWRHRNGLCLPNCIECGWIRKATVPAGTVPDTSTQSE